MSELSRLAAILLAAASASACVDPGDDAEDDDEDVVLGGKGDGALAVTPAEHAIMMSIASYHNVDMLRNDVGLSQRAAENIVKAQNGADGRRGTSDDTYFKSIGQLDKVPYVTKLELEKIRNYTRTMDVFPEGASERWSVRGGSHISTQLGGGLWGGTPAFAIDRDGKLLALYMGSIDDAVLEIDGVKIAVPSDDRFLAYQYDHMQLAVDKTNTIHVFYGVLYKFKHLTYKNGTWTEQLIEGDRIQVANGRNGEVYALIRGERRTGGFNPEPFAELHTFQSDGTSTVEIIPDVPLRTASSLAVGADGTPIIGWTDATASPSSPPTGFKFRRVTASGPEVSSFAIPSTWGATWTLLASGAATPTAILSNGSSTHVLRKTDAAFAEVDITAYGVSWPGRMFPASTDGNGLVTACASAESSYHLTELTVDANGAAERRPLANYPATKYCFTMTDSQGASHLIIGDPGVYIHAQID